MARLGPLALVRKSHGEKVPEIMPPSAALTANPRLRPGMHGLGAIPLLHNADQLERRRVTRGPAGRGRPQRADAVARDARVANVQHLPAVLSGTQRYSGDTRQLAAAPAAEWLARAPPERDERRITVSIDVANAAASACAPASPMSFAATLSSDTEVDRPSASARAVQPDAHDVCAALQHAAAQIQRTCNAVAWRGRSLTAARQAPVQPGAHAAHPLRIAAARGVRCTHDPAHVRARPGCRGIRSRMRSHSTRCARAGRSVGGCGCAGGRRLVVACCAAAG